MSIPEPQGLGSALNCESPEDLLSIQLPVVWPKLAKHPRLDYPVLTPKGIVKYLLLCLTSFLDAAHITLLIPHSSGSKSMEWAIVLRLHGKGTQLQTSI